MKLLPFPLGRDLLCALTRSSRQRATAEGRACVVLQGSGIASKVSVREVSLCLTDRAGPRRKKAELEAEGSTQ